MGTQTHNSVVSTRRAWFWSGLAAWAFVAILLPTLCFAQGGGGLSGGEVQIQLDKFGVGNMARKGDWAGIRLKIQDTSAKQRELLIRVDGQDSDGDTPEFVREFTSNPGVWQNEWAYVRLPFSYEGGFSASVYEAIEVSGRTDEYPTGYKPGRRLGYMPINPMGGSVLRATDGIIGMIGTRELGLQMYYGGANSTGEAWHPQGHERSAIAMGITPADLPDRWMGLSQFDAIVWGQGDPAELRGDRASAVRDWVMRGGHLIIILPGVGQTWTNKNSNDLIDIMPAVSVSRKEVADLSGYRDLIMRRPQNNEDARPFPKSGVVHTFKPQPDAQPGEAERILNNPEGECIVARRLVGAGVVTLIGLDLNQTAFSQFHTVDADVFWHRILGRRGSLEEPKSTTGKPNYLQMMNQRRPYLYDQDIPTEISKSGQAAGGVLVGFVVFVLYWLLAGPVGFGLLKFRKWTQHAWVAFVLAAAAFTAVSWTGATMLRPAEVEAKHLTFLDHVYGQPIQRARMWASLMIPWYGTARIGIAPGEDDSSGKHMVNAITAWDSFVADSSGAAGFPDVRGYEVDTKAPEVMVAPSRSTVKQIEGDWAGGPRWEMPRPARPDEKDPGTGKLVLNDSPPTQEGVSLIEGVLTHNLPGPLEDVLVVVVRRLPMIAGGPIDMPIADAFKYTQAAWYPGTPLDLSLLTKRKPGDRTSFSSYASLQKPTGNNDLGVSSPSQNSDGHKADRLTALAFFSQLEPPQLGDSVQQYAAQRMATHGWDLGVWFTHPCVIIVGRLSGWPSPVPLTVDGKPVKTEGTTYVRWVYPLPDNPPAYSNTGESLQFPHGAPTPEPATELPHEGGITNPALPTSPPTPPK